MYLSIITLQPRRITRKVKPELLSTSEYAGGHKDNAGHAYSIFFLRTRYSKLWNEAMAVHNAGIRDLLGHHVSAYMVSVLVSSALLLVGNRYAKLSKKESGFLIDASQRSPVLV